MAEHTPERWRLHEKRPYTIHVVAANGHRVAALAPPRGPRILSGGDTARVVAEQRATGRRIVAAVNAVAGIATEALEEGVVRELIEACESAEAVLRETPSSLRDDAEDEALDALRAALRLAKWTPPSRGAMQG